MKHKLLFLIAVSFLLISNIKVKAQEIDYGVKAGLNYSNFETSNTGRFDFEYKFFYHAGIYAEVSISEKIKIQPELLYSAQGSKVFLDESDLIGGTNPGDPVISGSKSELKYSFNYLLLPIMLKYNLYKGFFVTGGPQLGYLISSKQEFIDNSNSYYTNHNFNGDFKKITFDFNFGIGYEFNNGINVNLRYSLGLNNINKSDFVEYKNSVYQFSIGYSFLN
jgi:hypothetical protein